ncbi:MAG TPA: nucleoside hydrolase [Thermoleophilaceae bacterium]|nr:nucleoside hydrolase [Thermoleophilaceae bacterium]
MTAVPTILDCDPGHDDMVAILLAAADASIDLLAITTVAGNGTLERTTHNARAVCSMAGIRDVPIAAGAAGPLVGSLRTASHVHGESGLEGAELAAPDVPLAGEHAVELMARLLRESAQQVTLVPTGPLTNVALLLRTHPELAERVREIVLMGGSTGVGNVEPLAEFNIHVDPEAADVVFSSGLPVTMCGLNVTHQALATEEVLEQLRGLGTPLADTVVRLLGFFRDRYRDIWGLPAPPVHDPVAVARVIDPALVRCVDAHVAVELHGTHTRGATVCDRFGRRGCSPNARVAVELDAPGFWELVVSAVERLGR